MKSTSGLSLLLPLPLLFAGPAWAACPVFPADNVWNTPVTQLPVDARSNAYVASIGATTGLHPDFGSGTWDGGPMGIPYNTVSSNPPKVPVAFDYADESDPGPYPIPASPVLEYGSDHHLLIMNQDDCTLYETWDTRQQSGAWKAGSGAMFNLRSNALRPSGWTSADAAGLPVLPGLARCEDLETGAIHHALRFTAQRTQRKFVWPARHYASSITDPNVPPMGQRFRLKAGFNSSGYSPQTQIILTALKTYGMFLADNGSNWYLSGAPGACWNDEALVSELRTVKGSAFEAVDESSLMVSADSGQVKTTTPALVTLIVSRLGDGSGTVTSLPAGMDCGATCEAHFYPNALVTLTATPTAGSTFYGWGGGCNGMTSPITLTLTGDSVCSATFGATPTSQLADLATGLTQPSSSVGKNQKFNYTVTVKNQGPAPAATIYLTVTLPTRFTLVSTPTGCTYANATVKCPLNTLASGQVKTVTLPVKPTLKGRFSATARTTSTTSDPNVNNNTATLTTAVY
ncbi:exported hypothetical protein [Candidatus Contendobacter odensis Run_B_J11]|uniref:DUF11 domain-containing protein n=2 Tax=Candidatus Contendibacter odensensis TaxID=1400860 RepID=A0A7U7J4U6_9GAMM|nr:DUF11 domain-containing protein [Candidatus Contendobacter odensis]CDH45591.1 exported hypothetical protein [Candidatus Contendobacter odensis Run_B_J11]